MVCLGLASNGQSPMVQEELLKTSADNGDGTYHNPILHADYSDPDAIRVGADFYMIASSFNHVPGLPILHSQDLVNWSLIGYALQTQIPIDRFSIVQHGNGVWAPSIRYHKNEFYIYYPDPDAGIYLIKSKSINGPWTAPILVQEGKGLIDPCPLWDNNGKVYLVHAYAGSRAGIKSIIVVEEMNAEGNKVISEPVMVYDGHGIDPTIEGPKFYKRNGYYYIFAPAGGVSTGWQVVLRSKNIYGPYERKVVMDQGLSSVNGPHQGAWVTTNMGEDWFIHFQDKEAYGRVVHLQPMKWLNDWPVIGSDADADGKGEPVLTYKKPSINFRDFAKFSPIESIPCSDDFNNSKLGLQWQWQANPKEGWVYPTSNGSLRMFSVLSTDSVSLYNTANILAQKIPAETFTATVKVNFQPRFENEKFGLIVFGLDIASLSLVKKPSGITIEYAETKAANKGGKPLVIDSKEAQTNVFFLRVRVEKDGECTFFSSVDGEKYQQLAGKFTMKPGLWVGAKIGMYCSRNNITNDAGYADIDWIHFTK
jgi:beta-xylosidase